jgi:plastocyanin
MTMGRAAATIAVVVITACGGEADLKVGSTNTGGAHTSAVNIPAPDGSSNVTGKLSPAMGPPSTLIVLDPQGATDLPIKAEPAIMDQAGYEFLPGFLIAQAGQQVQFRNSEDVLHNVRVTEISTQKPIFNVATLAFGKYQHAFDPGYYNVTCDIHTTMRASILVTASPYTATTAEDGSFSINNVKPGQYNLTIYAGPTAVVRSVEVKGARTDLGVIR